MNLKIITERQIFPNLKLEKDAIYPVLDIIQDSYKIAVPMKQKGKFWNVLVNEKDGELID